MYLDTPHSSSLAKIQLAFCSQESLAIDRVGSCCFKSKRLLTKPLPSKQQIYGLARWGGDYGMWYFKDIFKNVHQEVFWAEFISWELHGSIFPILTVAGLCNASSLWNFLWLMMAISLVFYILIWPYWNSFLYNLVPPNDLKVEMV